MSEVIHSRKKGHLGKALGFGIILRNNQRIEWSDLTVHILIERDDAEKLGQTELFLNPYNAKTRNRIWLAGLGLLSIVSLFVYTESEYTGKYSKVENISFDYRKVHTSFS